MLVALFCYTYEKYYVYSFNGHGMLIASPSSKLCGPTLVWRSAEADVSTKHKTESVLEAN